MRVARAVRESVLRAFPAADLSLDVVWVDVLAADGPEGAERSAQLFDDPRVRQFHDGSRRAARALAGFVGMPSMRTLSEARDIPIADLEDVYLHDFVHGAPAAFDSVLFFAPEAEWTDEPPAPVDWVTQLDPGMFVGIDPEHFRYGDELAARLRDIATDLLARDDERRDR